MKVSRFSVTRRNFLKNLAATGVIVGSTRSAHTSTPAPAEAAPVVSGSSDWPRFGCDLRNSRFNSKETQLGRENVGQLDVKWTFETDAPIQTTPTVIGDTIYFGTLSGYQYALESATGAQKWRHFIGYSHHPGAPTQGVRSSCQFDNGRIYFGTGLAKVHCLDADSGRELWQTQIDKNLIRNRTQIFCSPAVYKNKVYLGTSSGQAEAVCLDAETGAVRWRFYVVPDRARDAGGSIWTSPSIDETANIVYFATGSVKSFIPADPMLFAESLIACDADTGEMLWYDQPTPADPFDMDYSCHPMIFDATHPSRNHEIRSCVGAGNKAGFFCFNRYTGEKLWKTMLTHATNAGGPRLNSTATAYNRVFVVSNATGIRGRSARSVTAALHAYTGDVMWWVVNSAPIGAPVAVANHVFYQGLTDGVMEAIDAISGEQLWKHQFTDVLRGGMAIANGHLYTSIGAPSGWKLKNAIEGKKYAVYAFSPNGD